MFSSFKIIGQMFYSYLEEPILKKNYFPFVKRNAVKYGS